MSRWIENEEVIIVKKWSFYPVAKTFQLQCSQKWIYVFVISATHSCSELVLTEKKIPNNSENKFIKYNPHTTIFH